VKCFALIFCRHGENHRSCIKGKEPSIKIHLNRFLVVGSAYSCKFFQLYMYLFFLFRWLECLLDGLLESVSMGSQGKEQFDEPNGMVILIIMCE
jgi:hypothetical protein